MSHVERSIVALMAGGAIFTASCGSAFTDFSARVESPGACRSGRECAALREEARNYLAQCQAEAEANPGSVDWRYQPCYAEQRVFLEASALAERTGGSGVDCLARCSPTTCALGAQVCEGAYFGCLRTCVANPSPPQRVEPAPTSPVATTGAPTTLEGIQASWVACLDRADRHVGHCICFGDEMVGDCKTCDDRAHRQLQELFRRQTAENIAPCRSARTPDEFRERCQHIQRIYNHTDVPYPLVRKGGTGLCSTDAKSGYPGSMQGLEPPLRKVVDITFHVAACRSGALPAFCDESLYLLENLSYDGQRLTGEYLTGEERAQVAVEIDEAVWAGTSSDACRKPRKSTDCAMVARYARDFPQGSHLQEATAMVKASEPTILRLHTAECKALVDALLPAGRRMVQAIATLEASQCYQVCRGNGVQDRACKERCSNDDAWTGSDVMTLQGRIRYGKCQCSGPLCP